MKNWEKILFVFFIFVILVVFWYGLRVASSGIRKFEDNLKRTESISIQRGGPSMED